MSRTIQDELGRNFSEATAPVNTFASAAEPNDNTYPAAVPRAIGLPSELPSLLADEYQPLSSNLPEQVPAATVAQESMARMYNVGPAPSEAKAPMLAGTKVAVDSFGSGEEFGEAIAEGDPKKAGEAIGSTLSEVTGGLESGARFVTSFDEMRRRAGGR